MFFRSLALSALTGMNIPMYNAIRRCVPLVSLILGLCMLQKQKPTPIIVISILMITIGTLFAASGDLDFEIKAYIFGLSSVLFQALYLNTLQSLEMSHHAGALNISYINSINCLPVFISIVLLTGEGKSVVMYSHWMNPTFVLSYSILVFYGCLFTYSMFLCTTYTSALTTSLVGVAKSALTTIIGMYAFGGVAATKLMILGQSLNLLGGTVYAYEKYKLNESRSPVIKNSSSVELGPVLNPDSSLIQFCKNDVVNLPDSRIDGKLGNPRS